jgi:hypothetical protein
MFPVLFPEDVIRAQRSLLAVIYRAVEIVVETSRSQVLFREAVIQAALLLAVEIFRVILTVEEM